MRELTGTPLARSKQLLARLRGLLADGAAASAAFQCQTAWAEIEDLLEHMGQVKDELPEGLYRPTCYRLKDCRRLLAADATDRSAREELRRVEAVLARAVP